MLKTLGAIGTETLSPRPGPFESLLEFNDNPGPFLCELRVAGVVGADGEVMESCDD